MRKFNVNVSVKEYYLTQEIQAETLEQAMEQAMENVSNGDVAVVSQDAFEVSVSEEKEEETMTYNAPIYSDKEYCGWSLSDVIEQLENDEDRYPKLTREIIKKDNYELQFEILMHFLDRLDVSDQIDLLNDSMQRFEDELED